MTELEKLRARLRGIKRRAMKKTWSSAAWMISMSTMRTILSLEAKIRDLEAQAK